MQVSVRELRNRTAAVVAAVQAGESVTVTSNGEPVADIVPHGRRARWLPGEWLAGELSTRQADATLTADLVVTQDDDFTAMARAHPCPTVERV